MTKKELSPYDYHLIWEEFHNTIEWLEKFIEIFYPQEFPDWENRKQIKVSSITRKDIYQHPEHARNAFGTSLLIFWDTLEDYRTGYPVLIKDFKQEFYRWINLSGINADSCPTFLKSVIFEINQTLEGSNKIQRDIENRKRRYEPTAEDMNNFFGKINELNFQNQKKAQKLTEKWAGGKWHEIENRFLGNAEVGEKTFQQIANSLSKHEDFYFVEQKDGKGKWEGKESQDDENSQKKKKKRWTEEEARAKWGNRFNGQKWKQLYFASSIDNQLNINNYRSNWLNYNNIHNQKRKNK